MWMLHLILTTTVMKMARISGIGVINLMSVAAMYCQYWTLMVHFT